MRSPLEAWSMKPRRRRDNADLDQPGSITRQRRVHGRVVDCRENVCTSRHSEWSASQSRAPTGQRFGNVLWLIRSSHARRYHHDEAIQQRLGRLTTSIRTVVGRRQPVQPRGSSRSIRMRWAVPSRSSYWPLFRSTGSAGPSPPKQAAAIAFRQDGHLAADSVLSAHDGR